MTELEQDEEDAYREEAERKKGEAERKKDEEEENWEYQIMQDKDSPNHWEELQWAKDYGVEDEKGTEKIAWTRWWKEWFTKEAKERERKVLDEY